MSRSLYRFDYYVMKQQVDPYSIEFLHLVESQLSAPELGLHFPKDSLNSKQKNLLQAYNRSVRLNIYYFTLYTYLNDHKEWGVKGLCDTDVSMTYTSEELELLYRKHLQYKETSEYIYHILYNSI